LETLFSDAVVTFLGIARSVAAGTCDARGMPHGTRAAAVRIWPDRQHVTLYLADAIAATTLKNVRETGRLALQVSHPIDHRTLQLKGRAANVRPASEDERAYVTQFVLELSHVLDKLGLPLKRVQRMAHWPASALDLCVEEIYLQTPGPGAGQPLSGRAP
jgi:hypothetical protein